MAYDLTTTLGSSVFPDGTFVEVFLLLWLVFVWTPEFIDETSVGLLFWADDLPFDDWLENVWFVATVVFEFDWFPLDLTGLVS